MGSIRSKVKGRREQCLLCMRSDKESHVMKESPADSVCRSDLMDQFLPDFKCVQKILALACQNYFAFVLVIIKVHSLSTIKYSGTSHNGPSEKRTNAKNFCLWLDYSRTPRADREDTPTELALQLKSELHAEVVSVGLR